MSVGVVTWSKTSANNDVADTAINFQEGQAPSSLNDSCRAVMSSVAKWRDDIAGTVLVTGGVGTAYTLATNQVFAANNNGNTIQFTPNLTNTGAVTLAVDGLTALPLRFLTGTDLPSGVLISGSLYQATLRSSEWLLHSSPLAQPFLIPIGGIIDYGGSTAPNSNFVLPQGQAINRTTYATLFSLFGTTYGTGDGSTTFNVPDLVGRVVAMLDAGSSRLSSTYLGSSPATLGNAGGSQNHTLTTAELPAHSHANTLADSGHTHTWGPAGSQANIAGTGAAGTISLLQVPGGITSANATQSISVTSNVSNVVTGTVLANAATTASATRQLSNDAGSGSLVSSASNSISVTSSNTGAAGNGTGAASPVATVQPTIILNKILRVI
jgi:microcystin-dependent protein